MILRFLGPDGGTTSDAIASLQYAVANGATVSNNSWGGGPYSQALYDAIKAAGDAGHIFVAAAGNSYNNNDTFPTYPASYDLDNIIAVAATGNRDNIASFSNYGGASVDLGAPGVDIVSSYWDPETPTDDYWYSSGTSMAAPHVAGVVALVQAVEAQEDASACLDPDTLTKVGVVERVLRSARPVEQIAPYVATGGIVNAADAVNCSLNLPWPLPAPPPLPVPPAMPPDDLQAIASMRCWVPAVTPCHMRTRQRPQKMCITESQPAMWLATRLCRNGYWRNQVAPLIPSLRTTAAVVDRASAIRAGAATRGFTQDKFGADVEGAEPTGTDCKQAGPPLLKEQQGRFFVITRGEGGMGAPRPGMPLRGRARRTGFSSSTALGQNE
jgi:hypothetical protein